MRNTLIVPSTHIKPLYYKLHIIYVIKFFEYLGYDIHHSDYISKDEVRFIAYTNDEKCVFDFSDYTEALEKINTTYYKFHPSEQTLKEHPTIRPFPPISFYSWEEYYTLADEIKYTCNTDRILNMQRPHTQNYKRRVFVQKMLRDKYGENAITHLTNVTEFWDQINSCLVSVCVPGARNDIIDRGHLQYLALGCCTISPEIIDVFPGNVKLLPGVHYLACNSDYSDLLDIIEYCKCNRQRCMRIGLAARHFFSSHCTPEAFVNAYNN